MSYESQVCEAPMRWPVLVMDDEPDVLAVTELALEGFQVDGREVELDLCETREEALNLLRQRSYAVAIRDVVLRNDQTRGLELVKSIRSMDNQRDIQLVVRTGQPGVAPEKQVVENYRINDYWPKTEISMDRMRTVLTGLIRSHASQREVGWERDLYDRSYQTLVKGGFPQSSDSWGQVVHSFCELVQQFSERPIGLLVLEASTQGTPLFEEDRELKQQWLTLPLECLEESLQNSVRTEWKSAELQQLFVDGQRTPSFVLVMSGEDDHKKWQMVPMDWMQPQALEIIQKNWRERELQELREEPVETLSVYTLELKQNDGAECLYLLVWTPEGRSEQKHEIHRRFFEDILTLYAARLKEEGKEHWELSLH